MSPTRPGDGTRTPRVPSSLSTRRRGSRGSDVSTEDYHDRPRLNFTQTQELVQFLEPKWVFSYFLVTTYTHPLIGFFGIKFLLPVILSCPTEPPSSKDVHVTPSTRTSHSPSHRGSLGHITLYPLPIQSVETPDSTHSIRAECHLQPTLGKLYIGVISLLSHSLLTVHLESLPSVLSLSGSDVYCENPF